MLCPDANGGCAKIGGDRGLPEHPPERIRASTDRDSSLTKNFVQAARSGKPGKSGAGLLFFVGVTLFFGSNRLLGSFASV